MAAIRNGLLVAFSVFSSIDADWCDGRRDQTT